MFIYICLYIYICLHIIYIHIDIDIDTYRYIYICLDTSGHTPMAPLGTRTSLEDMLEGRRKGDTRMGTTYGAGNSKEKRGI